MPDRTENAELNNLTAQNPQDGLNGSKPHGALQPRIQQLINQLSEGMLERDETVAVTLLGALGGQNSFLLGPPGTAKSMISRRIACAFEKPEYFEYLINRFSTPEEVFGPVSIKELKEDNYVRKTEHYIPKADFTFLDEIWKSSPAILNTLLTLINEGTYRIGTVLEQVPLKALIAASNETPEPNQGLEALFDRFVIRLFVGPIELTNNFDFLLNAVPVKENVQPHNTLRISQEEWIEWRERIQQVRLSKETLTIVHLIRQRLAEKSADLVVYISDRRWQRAAMLMRASAFFNDRQQTNHSDVLLLQHCLWTNSDNRTEVTDIVASAVKDVGFDSGINIADLDHAKETLDTEIHTELYHSADVYKTTKLGGKEFIEVKARNERNPSELDRKVYIPVAKIKSKVHSYPFDEKRQKIDNITVKFDGQGSFSLTYTDNYQKHHHHHYHNGNVDSTIHKLSVLFHKGRKIEGVNPRLVNDLIVSVRELREKFAQSLCDVSIRFDNYDKELSSPFIPPEKTRIALQGITDQMESLKLRCADCDRLEELCR